MTYAVKEIFLTLQGEGAHAAGESTDAPGAARCGDEFDVN